MIPVGTAAGIAAIFRTPITGVVFAVEEVLGTTSRGVLGGTIVAAVAAAVVQHLLLGKQRLLPASAASWTHVSELIGFALVGVLTAEHRHRQYSIVSSAGVLEGMLGAAAIVWNVRDAKFETSVGELMEQPKVVARADEPLHDVIARMAVENVDRCPVVAADGSKRVVGFLSPADLVLARFRREAPSERADITLF